VSVREFYYRPASIRGVHILLFLHISHVKVSISMYERISKRCYKTFIRILSGKINYTRLICIWILYLFYNWASTNFW